MKGGTALNLFYLGLDRLSVDIDLNYVGAEDRKKRCSPTRRSS
ncbi:nucleotidyl transferase AbiEii/AbiGii toxin family protein [Bradyrhizobium sp. 157]|nr:nucleotidyl transferase AbiEii/AbiGii toxin family protein [Bradyrhizobium sp. 157]